MTRSIVFLALSIGLLFAFATSASATQPEAAAEPAMTGSVARATFALSIQDREPVDALSSEASGPEEVVFFTDLRDLAGHTVTHRWEWNGQVMAEIPFEVGGPRWRVWSTKQLQPEWLGDWTVSVVDATGTVLSSQTVTVTAAAAAQTESSETPAPPASLDAN